VVSCTCSITNSDKRRAKVENLIVYINLVYNVVMTSKILIGFDFSYIY
jgi:hypothetical protein